MNPAKTQRVIPNHQKYGVCLRGLDISRCAPSTPPNSTGQSSSNVCYVFYRVRLSPVFRSVLPHAQPADTSHSCGPKLPKFNVGPRFIEIPHKWVFFCRRVHRHVAKSLWNMCGSTKQHMLSKDTLFDAKQTQQPRGTLQGLSGWWSRGLGTLSY